MNKVFDIYLRYYRKKRRINYIKVARLLNEEGIGGIFYFMKKKSPKSISKMMILILVNRVKKKPYKTHQQVT